MVSVMPPSGVGGGLLAGPHGFGPHPDLASRYNLAVMDSYYQQIANQNYLKRKTVEAAPRGQRAKKSTSSEAVKDVKPKLSNCGLAGCKGCSTLDALKAKGPSIGDGGPPRVRSNAANVKVDKPLFVDCSVEYELPMVPKIPPDSQPLLVIHPGWQQKRRITRSSSQQRIQAEERQRMALQQQHYLQQQQYNYVCSQCPPMTTSSRKRSYQQANSLPLQPQMQPPPPASCCYQQRPQQRPQQQQPPPGKQVSLYLKKFLHLLTCRPRDISSLGGGRTPTVLSGPPGVPSPLVSSS